MKKIIGIIFLSFLSINNSSAKTILLNCEYTHIDEKDPFLKVGEETLYEFNLKSKSIIVTNREIKLYLVTDYGDTQYTGYIKIDRFTGNLIQKSAEVPRNEIKKLLDEDIINKQMLFQDEETYEVIEKITNNRFYKNKASKLSYFEKPFWLEYNLKCNKAKKKF